MRCKKCRNELNPGQRFCPVCGTPNMNKKGKKRKKSKAGKVVLLLAVFDILAVVCGLLTWRQMDGTDEIAVFQENEDLYYSDIEEAHIAREESSGIEYADNEAVIIFQNGTSKEQMEQILAEYGGSIVGYIEAANTCQARFQNALDWEGLESLCEQLNQHLEVQNAKPNIILDLEASEYPNDTKWKKLWGEVPDGINWGMEAIHAPEVWDYREQMAPVNVGIYDSVFYKHEDLKFQELMYRADKSEIDTSHGTHVAGIIGATYNNRKGVCGVFPKAQLYGASAKKTGAQYKNSIIAMQAGLAYLIHLKQCKVINISRAWAETAFAASRSNMEAQKCVDECADYIGEYLEKFLDRGDDFVICKSAGNQNSLSEKSNHKYIRADEGDKDATGGYIPYDKKHAKAYQKYEKDLETRIEYGHVDAKWDFISAISNERVKDRIIVVGAAQNEGNGEYSVCDFSNGGERVDIVAPGRDIYSTILRGNPKVFFLSDYALKEGTSMAAPFVSGVAAMLFSLDSTLTGAEVKDIIRNTAEGAIEYTGAEAAQGDRYPMLNAESAVKEVIERKSIPQTEGQETVQDGDLYSVYKNAADCVRATGNWREEMNGIIAMDIASADEKEKAKMEANLEVTADVQDYDSEDLSKLKISGNAALRVGGQNIAWTVEYADGVAHYEYTEPTQYSNDMAIDPVYFEFSKVTEDMMQNASMQDDTIRFTVSGEDLTALTEEAVDMMNSFDDLQYGDGEIKIVINRETGCIDSVDLAFHASMSYQGYLAEADYELAYRFIPGSEKVSAEETDDSLNRYASIFEEYRQAMKFYEEYGEELQTAFPDVNTYLVQDYYPRGGTIWYGFYDIDQNGAEELFFGYETIDGVEWKIVDVFAYDFENAKILRLGGEALFSENVGSAIYEDGTIYINTGEAQQFYQVHDDGWQLDLIDEYTTVGTYPNKFYFNDTELLDEEEFNQKINGMGNTVTIDWQKLSDTVA